MRSSRKSKSPSSDPSPIPGIIGKFTGLYFDKFGIKPAVNGAWCGKMIKDLLVDHSPQGLMRIIELYFEDTSNVTKVYHLPTILSAWSLNKYLPRIKYDPYLYDNAEEINKEIW